MAASCSIRSIPVAVFDQIISEWQAGEARVGKQKRLKPTYSACVAACRVRTTKAPMGPACSSGAWRHSNRSSNHSQRVSSTARGPRGPPYARRIAMNCHSVANRWRKAFVSRQAQLSQQARWMRNNGAQQIY